MDSTESANDLSKTANPNAENSEPIPVIETLKENTIIEKTVVDSIEKAAPAPVSKPISLSFLSDERFQKMYKDIEDVPCLSGKGFNVMCFMLVLELYKENYSKLLKQNTRN